MKKLTGSQDLCLETVNTEKRTMKAKIIHKNCPNKKTNHLSTADRIDDWFLGRRKEPETHKNRYGEGVAAAISDSCDNQIVLKETRATEAYKYSIYINC